jgi:hypothetical protein
MSAARFARARKESLDQEAAEVRGLRFSSRVRDPNDRRPLLRACPSAGPGRSLWHERKVFAKEPASQTLRALAQYHEDP